MTGEELETKITQANSDSIKGNFDRAEQLVREVLAELESPAADVIDAPLHHTNAILALANVEQKRGNYEAALSRAEQGLAIAEEYNLAESKGRALNIIGNVYKHLSDYEKALAYYQRSLVSNEEAGSKYGIAANFDNIGSVYKNVSDYAKALEYLQKALTINLEIDRKDGVAGNLHNIGEVYRNLSDYANALEYLQRAMSINEEIGNKAWLANNLGSIGLVYKHLSDSAMALEYLWKAHAINDEIGNTLGIAGNLTNIGSVYLNHADYSNALEYMQKALAIYRETGSRAGIAANLSNIGEVYSNRSDFANALRYFQMSLAINEEIGNKSGIAVNLATMGEMYAKQKFDGYDAKKAEEYMLKAIAIGAEIGEKRYVYVTHKCLADLYENENRVGEAFEQFKKFYDIEKEVQSEDAKKHVQMMEQSKQVAEREKEIAIEKAKANAEMNVTTTLLHKVLPSSIAARLIKGEKVADYFAHVSILFADIVGFTPIAAKMPARKVLAFLNYVFGEFDRIIEKHGCEKIKTIGDGYMAVAGAPIVCEDHAERITRAAIEMMGDLQLPDDIRVSLPKGSKFNIRIGINSGPAFGGIVGENRFVYDIYSDAVNMAARMESHGKAGRIHVSEDFAFHLLNRLDASGDDLGGIVLEERDEIEIKGKGMMKTYFLGQLK